jgi:hypothetical protein
VSRTLARRGLSALLTLACAAAAFLVALDQPAPSRAPAFALAGADGALTLRNDREGAALLQAAGLRPGATVEGSVTLGAGDERAVALRLRAEASVAQAGTGGGLMWERLVLAIDDVTRPAQPVALYAGRLADLGTLPLGALPGGGERRFRFRASLPAGAGDNAFQGAALTTAFVWTAVTAEAPATSAPAPAPATPPAAAQPAAPTPATPAPPAAAAAARLTGMPSGRCVKRRRYRLAARPLPGVRVKSIAVYVNGRKRGTRKPRKAALNLKRARRAKVAVRVVVATSAGAVTISRSYRLCKRR